MQTCSEIQKNVHVRQNSKNENMRRNTKKCIHAGNFVAKESLIIGLCCGQWPFSKKCKHAAKYKKYMYMRGNAIHFWYTFGRDLQMWGKWPIQKGKLCANILEARGDVRDTSLHLYVYTYILCVYRHIWRVCHRMCVMHLYIYMCIHNIYMYTHINVYT